MGRSTYPMWVSVSLFSLFTSIVVFFKYGVVSGVVVSSAALLYYLLLWSKDINMEGLSGKHNLYMMDMFKFVFLLFILSEVMFFFSIFWAFFDMALSPPVDFGESWPPMGVLPINPWGIPLFNTVVLLSSGATVTWSHHALLARKNATPGLVMTVVLATLFEGVQYYEYKEASFTMSDGVFGSVFYMATGFHGLHVLLGGLFLLYNLVRLHWGHFSSFHHLGLEFSILYWHFVDVVWLFLFVFVYWWSY